MSSSDFVLFAISPYLSLTHTHALTHTCTHTYTCTHTLTGLLKCVCDSGYRGDTCNTQDWRLTIMEGEEGLEPWIRQASVCM